jgi:hypothetical protein
MFQRLFSNLASILAFGSGIIPLTINCRAAPSNDDFAVVCSKPVTTYVRAKLPNGAFRPEYYAFGEGGFFAGELNDDPIEKMNFTDVAQVLAASLATQNYLPSKDPKKTDLLLLVYWGVTALPPLGATTTPAVKILRQAELGLADAVNRNFITDDDENRVVSALPMVSIERGAYNSTDFDVATFLGGSRKDRVNERPEDYWPAFSVRARSIIKQKEAPHYFVILMAYDFQTMWVMHRHQLEWATSFSVLQQKHDFAKDLPIMSEFASKFFGQESNGLLCTGIPQGYVRIGTVRSLGEAPQN